MGRLDEAHIELEKVLAKDPANEEANRMYTIIEPLQKSLEEVNSFITYKNFQPAIDRLTELVEVKVNLLSKNCSSKCQLLYAFAAYPLELIYP